MKIKTFNEINSVGFPESQILPHVKGDFELCGEMSAAYLTGELEAFLRENELNESLRNIGITLTKVYEYRSIKSAKSH